jgi:hydroxyacylglutathione hydrolase
LVLRRKASSVAAKLGDGADFPRLHTRYSSLLTSGTRAKLAPVAVVLFVLTDAGVAGFSPYNRVMLRETFPVGPLQCNCTILGDETMREAVVVDPGDNIPEILARLAKHKLTLKQILITHAHIDHVGGAMKLRAATGAPILLNQNDSALLKMLDIQAAWLGMAPPGKVEIDHSINESDTVTAGPLQGEVLHTPGHTEGSICLYFPAEKKLIAGDTLFAGSIGRTDLPGGSFDKIIRSLHEKVLALPDDTIVVPGHGPLTSISEERENNPFLNKL